MKNFFNMSKNQKKKEKRKRYPVQTRYPEVELKKRRWIKNKYTPVSYTRYTILKEPLGFGMDVLESEFEEDYSGVWRVVET